MSSVDDEEDCLSPIHEDVSNGVAHAHNLMVTPPADHRQVVVTPLLDHVGLADTVLNDAGSVKISCPPPMPTAAAPPRNSNGAGGRMGGIPCK